MQFRPTSPHLNFFQLELVERCVKAIVSPYRTDNGVERSYVFKIPELLFIKESCFIRQSLTKC
jgi:hypothetical protein